MKQRIRETIEAALAEVAPDASLPHPVIERTKREEHGEFTTNIAMVASQRLGRKPRELAEALASRIRSSSSSGDLLDSVEVAGPGFLNFRVARAAWRRTLCEVLRCGANWGRGEPREHPRILIEYPSPNPTGPLHVGHGRIAAVGDALARLLRFAGHNVQTECYLNDHGTKIRSFAASIAARAHNAEPPPDGYRGAYVHEISQAARRASVPLDDIDRLGEFGVAAMLEDIRQVLVRFRACPEHFTHERDLYARGEVQTTLDGLRQKGWLEERDGAVWFRSTEMGEDDKDRVVVRRTGEPTYFAADVAYHRDKLARGHDLLVNILGADHHGHLERMRAAIRALGHDVSCFEVLLVQIVTLLRAGQKVAMDKSSGTFVTLREVLDEVGVDAARFFFLMRHHDSPLDFDLELAKKRSMDNPVYYVQYAHARCASIARRATDLGFSHPEITPALFERLDLAEEIDLIRRLADFPQTVRESAQAREPHRIVYYALDIARAFQSYYTILQKVHDDPILPQQRHRASPEWRSRWDIEKTGARLCWVEAIQGVLATALDLVGVQAPSRMERSPEAGQEEDDA